ncbi:MAG: N-acetylneuraminate synthase family protein [Crocinitomicaceae bacterium]|nr:N-acetylneuraminate synthase family protein [Crocinitomicaceae bacterium]
MKRTFIIAEIGPNHNGDINIAKSMVSDLSKIGVDAVKFQLAIPENVYSDDSFKADYQKENENSKTPLDMAKRHKLTFKEHLELKNWCSHEKIMYLCTAFDIDSLKFIDKELDVPIFKISSGENLTKDLIEYIAHQNKPILLSTGMTTYEEIGISLSILNAQGSKDITILHCISNYPASDDELNLNTLKLLKEKFKSKIGYSDHSLGNEACIAAVIMGAEVIEKHVTFDQNAEGPDHKASSTIEEFEQLVLSIRRSEKMLGNNIKSFSESEKKIRLMARKSIVSSVNIPKGTTINESMICFKRPGTGIPSLKAHLVIGKKAKCDISLNKIIKLDQLS